MKIFDLTYDQLPTVLAQAMKVKNVPELNWDLCGKLIEKTISLTCLYLSKKTNTNVFILK